MLTEQEIVERYKMGNTVDYIIDYCSREDFVERWHAKKINPKDTKRRLTKREIRKMVEDAIAKHIRQGSGEVSAL